jgi:hypothetical protein
MMTTMDKETGKGEMSEGSKALKQSGRGGNTSRKQQGTQGRGGRGGRGLITPPRAQRRSTRLNKQETDKVPLAEVGVELHEKNPFDVLRMEDEEEVEDEEIDEAEKMQVSPKWKQKSPRRPAMKRTEREDPSVGSMQRPATRGKRESKEGEEIGESLGAMLKEVEMEESPMGKEILEDDFLYAGKATDSTRMPSDEQDNLEDTLKSEVVSGNVTQLLQEVDDESKQAQKEGSKDDESDQPSEDVEWDETELEDEMRAARSERTDQSRKEDSITESHEGKGTPLAKVTERSAQEGRVEHNKLQREVDVEDTPIKSNSTKVNEEKARRQWEARKKLISEKKERSEKSGSIDEVEQESSDDSVTTIQQSNAKPGHKQTKTRRDFRQAVEGVTLPVFRGTLPRQYLFRYDLKLQIPANEEAVSTLIQTAKAFWAQILDTDKSAALVPWAEEHQKENPLLFDLTRFPTTLGLLKRYFTRAQPSTSGQTLYVSILMAHDMSFPDIMENVRWWLIEKKFGLWKRQVQSETVKPVGYLLYSTRSLEPEYMKQVVEKAVNRHKWAH